MNIQELVQFYKNIHSDFQTIIDFETIHGYVVEAYYLDQDLGLTIYTTEEFIEMVQKIKSDWDEEHE